MKRCPNCAREFNDATCPTCKEWKNASIVAGDFTLSYYRGKPDLLWIEHESGEGMTCPTFDLAMAVAGLWKERF